MRTVNFHGFRTFIESIQTLNYARCVHVLKVKRMTNPKHRYDAHCAPVVYHYFRPTHVEVRRIAFGNRSRLMRPVNIMSLWSLNTLHPKPAKFSQQLKQQLHIVTHGHHSALLLHNRFTMEFLKTFESISVD